MGKGFALSTEHRGDGPPIGNRLRDGPNLLPPRVAVLELIALFGLIVGIDWLITDLQVFQLQPHPFWLPVLLLSLQYGTLSGLMAAIVAILITSFGYPWPEQENGENLYAYAARTFTQPVLWIAAAVMLGQFRLRQIEAKRDLARAVDILTRQREDLASYARGLRARCDVLERDIVSRSEPSSLAALAALEALSAGSPGQPVASALEHGLAVIFPGASGFIVGRVGDRPVILAEVGERRDRPPRVALDGLYKVVVDRGRSLDVLSAEGEAELDGLGMIAVPIPEGAGRVGALVIDGLRPSLLSPATVPAAAALARALAPLLTDRSITVSPDVAPLVAVTTPAHRTIPLDAAKASRRWGRFGWLPGRTRGQIVETRTDGAVAPPLRPAAAKR